MALKFGTSGLRGLVTEMTPQAITSHVRGFLAACDCGTALFVGRDLRPSSPRIAGDVIASARQAGIKVIDCGALPTPALALAALAEGGGAVMVTGSHIPADRNGLKFYTSNGEITKADEAAIQSHLALTQTGPRLSRGALDTDPHAIERWIARYVDAFGADALKGQRIGLYAHSAVGRDAVASILAALGAVVIEVGRSENFIPVDTEAVSPETRTMIAGWVKTHALDALISTDGDSDRPLLADEKGQIVPGDILGQITAQALQARKVVTPISSNSGVTMKDFEQVVRTRIGSPFVIAQMQANPGAVVGYEANGGFLLGFAAQGPAGPLPPLMTRDCVLPLVVVLHAAQTTSVSRLVALEPAVVTLSDRLQDVPQTQSNDLIAQLSEGTDQRAAFLAPLGKTEASVDFTDGLRITLDDGSVVHVRPSGNAPELRLYIEAQDLQVARALMASVFRQLSRIISGTAELLSPITPQKNE